MDSLWEEKMFRKKKWSILLKDCVCLHFSVQIWNCLKIAWLSERVNAECSLMIENIEYAMWWFKMKVMISNEKCQLWFAEKVKWTNKDYIQTSVL